MAAVLCIKSRASVNVNWDQNEEECDPGDLLKANKDAVVAYRSQGMAC